ncbi:hypothetical protein [Acinetobacter chinensis]|uniref:hypothetical protein n=1 Tax=Acinetobacter chinensis TaxID=2004650 RepID=UPI002934122C|nr:hypothetical protein [Acinetobacter chinensis]WOE40046.1 hypothetical protein QSG87_08980 [Acinetobacter chinensis]
MNSVEKLKLTSELRKIIDQIPDVKGMEKLNISKRLRELIVLLTDKSVSVNTLFQSVLDGKTDLTLNLLESVKTEASFNPEDPLLIPAVKKLSEMVASQVSIGT